METRKINVDRKKLSSEDIQQGQNWEKVLSESRKLQPPLNKSIWYYGPIALASISVLISISLFAKPSQSEVDVENEPQQTQLVVHKKEVKEKEEVKTQIQKEEKFEKKITLKKEVKKAQKEKTKEKVVELLGDVELDKEPEEVVVHTEKKEPTKAIESKFVFAKIANKFEGELSLVEIQKNPRLSLNAENASILEFELSFFNGTEIEVVKIQGEKIPISIVDKITKVGAGSSLYFTKILANIDGENRVLPSLRFFVASN